MSIPKPGDVIGGIRLLDQAGRTVTTWQYKQRRPLVLVLWDEGDEALLKTFAHAYAQYRDLGAEVLAIGPSANPVMDLPFPCLSDPNLTTAARLTEALPAILVLDAFGELFQRWSGEEARSADHEAIAGELDFTGQQCEECDPHAENWPRRDTSLP